MQRHALVSTDLTTPASSALLMGMLMLCFAVAASGGIATADGIADWYPTLDKPPWTPPGWVFGPIWTFLYTAMAIAAWDITRRNPRKAQLGLGLFCIQLGLNAAWSPVFFSLQWTGAALLILTLLWVAIGICIVVFRRLSTLGAALMVPYLLWVSTAWSLNAWIFLFNESA